MNKIINYCYLSRRCVIFLLLIVSCLFFSSFSRAKAPISSPLIIATTDSWHPYSYTNEKGEAMGVLVNFWQEYSQLTGVAVEFKVSSWQESLDNVIAGYADAHVGMVRSDKREQWFDFIEPLFSIDTKLYFNRSLLEELSVKEFLSGGYDDYPVGVLFGGYQQDYMQTHYPNVKLKTFTNNQLMMHEALAGKLNAFVADTQVSNYFLHLGNKPGKLLPVQHLYTGVLYPAVAKASPLLEVTQQGFNLFTPEDKSRIVNRWMHHRVDTVYPRYLIPAIIFFVLIVLLSYIWVLKRSVENKTKALREMNARLTWLSETDSLTGIHNRRYFIQSLEAIPTQGSGICLMIFDIDNFKAVNDRFGHETGDIVIQFVAQQARSLLLDNQVLARVGGEEFAILACFLSMADAENFADHLVQVIAHKSGEHFPDIGQVTISLGLAYYPTAVKHYELSDADQALYQAKRNGKNQTVTYLYSAE